MVMILVHFGEKVIANAGYSFIGTTPDATSMQYYKFKYYRKQPKQKLSEYKFRIL